MPAERTSSGDPARTLALLWRTGDAAPRRGPRPRRSIDDVVEAAIAFADEAGLDALTVRALAARLTLSPMAVYTYVPGKAELLDLMLDTLYLRMARPAWRPEQGWRERLAAVAAANRALLADHPWAARVSTARPPLGPGLMAKYEHELAALDDAGLDDVDRDAALTFLLGFVQASVVATQDVAGAGDDEAWWEAAGPLLAQAMDAERYPLAVRVGAAAGAAQGAAFDPERAYAFGLERVLDGLAALIEPGPAPPRRR
jgi:AcrR family transcriptional regulator